jgi:hypothetical protein
MSREDRTETMHDKSATAAPKKRTEYFRMYQAHRRAQAASGGRCIECTTQPREQNSTRCAGCLERARDFMRIKRAVEA